MRCSQQNQTPLKGALGLLSCPGGETGEQVDIVDTSGVDKRSARQMSYISAVHHVLDWTPYRFPFLYGYRRRTVQSLGRCRVFFFNQSCGWGFLLTFFTVSFSTYRGTESSRANLDQLTHPQSPWPWTLSSYSRQVCFLGPLFTPTPLEPQIGTSQGAHPGASHFSNASSGHSACHTAQLPSA